MIHSTRVNRDGILQQTDFTLDAKDDLVSTKCTREVKMQIDTECAKEGLAG